MVFLEHSCDFRINRNGFFPQEKRWGIRWLVLNLSIPRMRTNIGNRHALFWVGVQYFVYEVLGGLTQERRNLIFRLDDFLI